MSNPKDVISGIGELVGGEVLEIPRSVLDLVEEIREGLDKSGPGGRKLTKREIKRVLRRSQELVSALLSVVF